MIKPKVFLPLIIVLLGNLHCAEPKTSSATAPAKPAPAASANAEGKGGEWLHFFSVAWGCVQVEKAKLSAASYTIQDFKTQAGACPKTVPVLSTQSSPLFECPVVIGAQAIPASYVLYDKRSLDGKTVSDMQAAGFTEANFCPAVAERSFK